MKKLITAAAVIVALATPVMATEPSWIEFSVDLYHTDHSKLADDWTVNTLCGQIKTTDGERVTDFTAPLDAYRKQYPAEFEKVTTATWRYSSSLGAAGQHTVCQRLADDCMDWGKR